MKVIVLFIMLFTLFVNAEDEYTPGTIQPPRDVFIKSVNIFDEVVNLDSGPYISCEINDDDVDEIDMMMPASKELEQKRALEICKKIKSYEGKKLTLVLQKWTQADDGEFIEGLYLRGVFFPKDEIISKYLKGEYYWNHSTKYIGYKK